MGWMLLAIMALGVLWLLVIGGVMVLCRAAKQGDAASMPSVDAAGPADVIPLPRRRVAARQLSAPPRRRQMR